MAEYISKENALWIAFLTNASEETKERLQNWKAADVQPVKRGHWIEKSEEYYRLWQDSGRSWDDMPYFVTGLKFACSCCFNQYDVNAEGVEEWDFCPYCGAKMTKQ